MGALSLARTLVWTVVGRQESPVQPQPDWQKWMQFYGHDVFQFPKWATDQMRGCDCSRSGCTYLGEPVDPATATELTYCVGKAYLLPRMSKFDQHYLPPSVTVDGHSMFDDNILFTLMTEKASRFTSRIPLNLRLAYILPYASFHEPRNNWRGLFFAKYFNISSKATSTMEAMQTLLPHTFQDWSGMQPVLSTTQKGRAPASGKNPSWEIGWSSSTAPPVTGPFDFVAYGSGSCTAWY